MKKYLAPIAVLATVSLAAPTAALANEAQKNAVEAAQQYLGFEAFSNTGLIGQLSSSYGEGFTPTQARDAVNKVYH